MEYTKKYLNLGFLKMNKSLGWEQYECEWFEYNFKCSNSFWGHCMCFTLCFKEILYEFLAIWVHSAPCCFPIYTVTEIVKYSKKKVEHEEVT